MISRTGPQRKGFVLLSVLGVLLGLVMLALATALAGRTALATARNRVALTAAQWKAEGCIERVRAVTYDAMLAVPPDAVIPVWDSLDHVIAASPWIRATSCAITVRAAGAGLNINTADDETLYRFFRTMHIGPARADSLVAALLDWRDGDQQPRTHGAESSWYLAHRRVPPRDSEFANVRELLLVRGFEHFGDTLNFLTTDRAKMPLSHTPLPVLASLPGMTPAALARAGDLRQRGQRLPELIALGVNLPKEAYAELIAHYSELSARTTPEPEAWLVTVTAYSGTPSIAAMAEVRLARAGTRIAILGRRL